MEPAMFKLWNRSDLLYTQSEGTPTWEQRVIEIEIKHGAMLSFYEVACCLNGTNMLSYSFHLWQNSVLNKLFTR